MFFSFAKTLARGAGQLAATWEVELAIASVLIETIESDEPIKLNDLISRASELLPVRVEPSEVLQESQRKLQSMLDGNVEFFERLVARTVSREGRRTLRGELDPLKESILNACRTDNAFAEYVKRRNTGTGS